MLDTIMDISVQKVCTIVGVYFWQKNNSGSKCTLSVTTDCIQVT